MSQRYIGGLIYNPPGGFSGYFDGSGDYLTIADNAAFQMGSGAFTIECWFFGASFASNQCLVTKWADGQSDANAAWGLDLTSGVIRGLVASSTTVTTWTGPAPATNAWNHAAFVRDGSNNVSLFLNGNRVATATYSSSINNGANAVNVGSANGNNRVFTGYISNARVVKGTAVYDPTQTTYTVPNGPLQAITNTSLLTCAYPTFRDGSSNNFTITVNGNTAVSTQNPFPQTQLPNPALGNQGNGVYSMSQYQALRSQNLWPAIDQYWPYVTMMLHGNGTNGAQNNTFLDSSTNNFTITRNGNTTQGTFTPYGTNWSNYFKSGDYLGFNSNSAFNMNTYCCLEAWVCYTSLSSSTLVVGRDSSYWIGYDFAGIGGAASKFVFSIYNTGASWQAVSSTTSPVVGVWYHVVGIKDNTTLRIYINGVQENTATFSGTAVTTSNVVQIAANQGTQPMVGYISNTRLVLGASASVLPYTGNFTPPTAPLTAVSGTAFLTCQSNRFVDNSSNAFSVIVNNTPSVQRFSPFNPTTPYAADLIGGSGYFDGSGDYLTVASNAAFAYGTGDFTTEFWFFPTNTNWSIPFDSRDVSGAVNNIAVQWSYTGNTSKVLVYANQDFRITSTNTFPTNAWMHIAVVRSGTTLTLYVNGTNQGTYTYSTNVTASQLYIGEFFSTGYPVTGYISNLRMVKGTAVYTAAFTPPTAPLTAITNTSLLLNFTNGGIIDNAMMNDLETVGNAQISTSVSKFGGGSIYLDGTASTYLQLLPNSQNFNFGASGDYTIEGWVYQTNRKTDIVPIFQTAGSNVAGYLFGIDASTGGLVIYDGGATRIAATASTVPLNTWTHVAATRSGGTTRVFINGVQAGSATYTYSSTSFADPRIGINASYTPAIYQGYIDDFRITKGYARYTANFTPQRSQWQDQ